LVPVNLEVDRFSISEVRERGITKKVENALCIQGMPGIANVGKTVINVMLKQNDAERISQIYFSDFPSHVSVDESGKVNALKSEIYFYYDEALRRDIFLLTGDAQPTSNVGMNVLSKYIAKTLHEMNVKIIIALGAMPVEKLNDKPRIFVTATSNTLLKEYGKLPNVEVLRSGIIIGMNGIVPCLASNLFNIDGMILLSETLSVLQKDLRASQALARILKEKLNLKIDLSAFSGGTGEEGKKIEKGTGQPKYIS